MKSLQQATPCYLIAPESSPHSMSAQSDSFLGDQPGRGSTAAEPGLLSLESFVHYVLWHSGTTCGVLSSAMCYVEAIRNKIPLIAGLERGIQGFPVLVEEEGSPQTGRNRGEGTSPVPAPPSPLLCPRRTFIAALVVVLKCLQDHCISNRVWAKICGLPPREISLCERALCEALEWRLWVGKGCSPLKTRVQGVKTSMIDVPHQ